MSLSEAFADDRAVTTGRLPCPPRLADRADTDAIDVFGDAAHLTAFANPPAVSVSAPVVADPDFGHLYGHSAVMRTLYGQIGKVSGTLATVLIIGESGTARN